MRRLALLLPIACLIAVAVAAVAAEQRASDELKAFMRAKLTHSQQILEGLTTDDLKSVAKHAGELSLLSQATNWQVLQTEEYLQQSRDFRRSADALKEAANKGNLDGAALAYTEMNIKCINCHKYVRNTRMASLPSLK